MKINKQAVLLAVAGLVVSSGASAMPGFSDPAPMSSIQVCVAEIGERANYDGAVRVRHDVNSKERRVSGHKIMIDTTVFGADGNEVIRAYATVCAVSDQSETKKFRFREKSI